MPKDPRLADAFGRPIRGLPWWEHEIHPDFWLLLHTGWVIRRPFWRDKLDAVAHVIARSEFNEADFRMDVAATSQQKNLPWLRAKESFIAVKWACQTLAGAN